MPSHIIKRTQKRTTSIWDFEHKDFAYEFFYKLALVEYMGYPVSMYHVQTQSLSIHQKISLQKH